MKELENKKIVIATHVYATGPAQDLREYLLKNKVGRLFFIGHPLIYEKRLKSSGFEIYEGGVLEKEQYGKIKNIYYLLAYIKDFLLSIFWIIKDGTRYDVYVGSNNLNALSGIVLRRLGKVKKVIYYVIDYNPRRFQNKFLNYVYQKIDQFSVKHADETWNLSPRMEEARQKYFNFSGGKQKVVPIGIWHDRFERPEFSKINGKTLVFMGNILEKQGVQYVLRAIPDIIKEVSDFKFLVIGGGDYLEKLKEQSRQLGIEKYVEFVGYVEKHEDVERMIANSALAIAMYEKYDTSGNLSFTYFADPGKIKSYLAGGLPVLLTDVSYNAKEIEEKRCGFVIDNDSKNITEAVVSILKNEEILKEYRQNALEYSRKFDWSLIFEENLKRII